MTFKIQVSLDSELGLFALEALVSLRSKLEFRCNAVSS